MPNGTRAGPPAACVSSLFCRDPWDWGRSALRRRPGPGRHDIRGVGPGARRISDQTRASRDLVRGGHNCRDRGPAIAWVRLLCCRPAPCVARDLGERVLRPEDQPELNDRCDDQKQTDGYDHTSKATTAAYRVHGLDRNSSRGVIALSTKSTTVPQLDPRGRSAPCPAGWYAIEKLAVLRHLALLEVTSQPGSSR